MNIIERFSYHSKRMTNSEQDGPLNSYVNLYSDGMVKQAYSFIKKSTESLVCPRLVCSAIRVIQNSIRVQSVYEKCLFEFDSLTLDLSFQLMELNDKDQEYWSYSQTEFVYSESTKTDDHNMIKNAISDFMKLACVFPNQKGDKYLMNILIHCANTLDNLKNDRTKNSISEVQIEAFLRVLESISSMAQSDNTAMLGLEEIISRIVVPFLQSDHPILVSRACSVIYNYNLIQYKDPDTIDKICVGISTAMVDQNNLAVRVKACMAVSSVMRNPKIKEKLKEHLMTILETMIQLMNEIELDDLVSSLETIITHFKDCIEPLSENLINRLGNQYMEYLVKAKKEARDKKISENLTESIKAADSCLNAIKNILLADISQETLKKSIPIVQKLLVEAFMENNPENLEKLLGLLNIIIYRQKDISDQELFFFPLICYVVTGVPQPENMDTAPQLEGLPDYVSTILKNSPLFGKGFDFFEVAMGCLLNFISKCSRFTEMNDYFGMKFVDLIFSLIKQMGINCNIKNADYDLCLSTQLIVCLLENHKGKVDDCLPKFLKISSELFQTERGQSLKAKLIQVVCSLFMYNPELTMEILVENGQIEEFLKEWFGNVTIFVTEAEKGVELLGIAGLLSLPIAKFPLVSTLSLNISNLCSIYLI